MLFKSRILGQLAQLENDLILLEGRVEMLENPPKKKRTVKKVATKKQGK